MGVNETSQLVNYLRSTRFKQVELELDTTLFVYAPNLNPYDNDKRSLKDLSTFWLRRGNELKSKSEKEK